MANKAREGVLSIINYQWNAELNHNEILIPVLGIFAPNQIENLGPQKDMYKNAYSSTVFAQVSNWNIIGVHQQKKHMVLSETLGLVTDYTVYTSSWKHWILINAATWMTFFF